MTSAVELLSSLSEETIRAVHAGDMTRDELSEIGEEEGFGASAGVYAHKWIRGHENVEFLVAAYVDGVAHSMNGAESPEVDGNRAEVTVRYPHGRPVRGVEKLMRDHGMAPGQWEIESVTVNEWPTTMSDDSGMGDVIYVNNFQAKARLSKKTR